MLHRQRKLDVEDIAHAEFLKTRVRNRLNQILELDTIVQNAQLTSVGEEVEMLADKLVSYRMALGKSMQINRIDNEMIRNLRSRLAATLRIVRMVKKEIE